MKPKSGVGAGMRRGPPSLWIWHNKEGHHLHLGTPAPARGCGAGLSLGGGSWLHPSHADKEIIPGVWAPGVRRALDWAPSPLWARHRPAKIDPKNRWRCTEETMTDSQSWGLVLLLLLFWRGARNPRCTRPASGFTGAEASAACSPLPSHWLLWKTFAIFSLGFSVSQCRRLSL